jgi:hypothetical protein
MIHIRLGTANQNMAALSPKTMKIDLRNSEQRAGLSALMMVVAVLTVGALAKLSVPTQLFHLAH